MKIYVLAVCILRKAMLLPLLMFIASTLVYAQEKVYVSSQTYQISGDCDGCLVQNPENAVGPDESNYALIEIGDEKLIEQTLIFPSVKTNSEVVIGFSVADLLPLEGVSVETFNGNISNNDSRNVKGIFVSDPFGPSDPSEPTKGTIGFTTSKPYDRILLRYRSEGNPFRVFRLYYAYQIDKALAYGQQVYVDGQSSQIYGACILCSVQNAENVVGSDENNYAFMNIPLGVAATIEQRLSFPSVKTNSKVVIGIGANQVGLSVQLLGGVSVETFNGNVSNNDFRIVNNEILKIGATDPSKGTIEFTTTKPYDRVVLKLSSAVGLNGGLRVYYAYQLNRVYASSETRIIKCPGCSVQNPQNAVGPNEVDFSKLIVPSSESPYTVRQNLHFPDTKTYTKLVVGVGSDSKPIDQVVGRKVFIDVGFGGSIIGGLKKDPQDPYKGVIEFMTSESYKSVNFTLGVDPNSDRDLKIYYAYQEDIYLPVVASANAMKTVPIEKVLTVFPNPTPGQVTLQGNIDFTDADIFINNTFGKEVFRSKFRSKIIDLPATLSGGIYMLSVQTKDREIYTHKIILTR